MSNLVFRGKTGHYTTGRELGKGGEGQVFELERNTGQVLKYYNDPCGPEKARKLELMAGLVNEKTQAYAAWPQDVVTGDTGETVGFVMKKLTGYVPLHMLFSPMDRKKIFPAKGYNFLVHVARNLAMAFHTLHSLELVVGDVNEGNILVNEQGMVAFIDCDSFQIKDDTGYHFCEVGVPRYTPPELLALSTFDQVVRTPDTDSFSMAVLIFQLLFLGRHPFAGRNMTTEDLDEEAAIRKRLFAYSLTNTSGQLLPPRDSFDIHNLSDGLIKLFHQAFEQTEQRPLPANWVIHLDEFLKDMVTCAKTKLHTYPSKLRQCPWCDFKDRLNILYFLDDGYFATVQALKDMERFINGFKLDKPKLRGKLLSTAQSLSITAAPIDKKYVHYKWLHLGVPFATLALCVVLGQVSFWFVIGGILSTALLYLLLPWKKWLKDELQKREVSFVTLSQKLEQALKEFQAPAEYKTYEQSSVMMTRLIQDYKNLPQDLQSRRRSLDERLYNEDLHRFLQGFDIGAYSIPNFGAARKQALYQAGIRNASDISRLKTIKVQGIGPKFIVDLFSWQRQISSNFVYKPDNQRIQREQEALQAQSDQNKSRLETEIRQVYHSMHLLVETIARKQDQWEKAIDALQGPSLQAEADFKAFQKIAG